MSSARPALRDPRAASGPWRSSSCVPLPAAESASRGLVLRQFLQAPPDRARRNPGCHRDRRDPTITRGECLRRRDQTTAPFIEKRGHRRKPLSDGFDIDHHTTYGMQTVVNPYLTLSKVDSIISGRALSVATVPSLIITYRAWIRRPGIARTIIAVYGGPGTQTGEGRERAKARGVKLGRQLPRYGETRGMDHVRFDPARFSQRANQKPSRPASRASAIRVIFLPALTASSRQRCSRPRSLSALGSSFFCG